MEGIKSQQLKFGEMLVELITKALGSEFGELSSHGMNPTLSWCELKRSKFIFGLVQSLVYILT